MLPSVWVCVENSLRRRYNGTATVCMCVEGKTVRRRFRFPRAIKRDVEKSTMVIYYIEKMRDRDIIYIIKFIGECWLGWFLFPYLSGYYINPLKIAIDMKNGWNCNKMLPAFKLFKETSACNVFVIFIIFFLFFVNWTWILF